MSCPEDACDAIDLVAATVDTLAGVVENDILGVDLVDRCASALRVAFTKDVPKVPFQQSRNAVRIFVSSFETIWAVRGLGRTWNSLHEVGTCLSQFT